MSAAAARRRKQLAARRTASGGGGEDGTTGPVQDVVAQQLETLLQSPELEDEATAYEALQLAQSSVRKRVVQGQFDAASNLAHKAALRLLKAHRVSVASQLLALLVQVLRETHAIESTEWLDRMEGLQEAHAAAMTALAPTLSQEERLRLQRLQREWLRTCLAWSSDLGTLHYGHPRLHLLLAQLSWDLSLDQDYNASLDTGGAGGADGDGDDDIEEDWILELQCDAVQHAALAERPDRLLEWLATLPAPTDDQLKAGHTCAPALRDGLLTRAVLTFVTLENLRDANGLIRGYLNTVESRTAADLTKSYTNKDDGLAPSHVMFCCMLVRTCEKDARTGPLYSWLLRSFRRELELLYRPNAVLAHTVKIGKVYFNILPPPSMLNMLENMMGMMGGGGGGMGGMPGGINPAMMQAALAQMQGGMM